MSPNWEENRIRELLGDLRSHDEAHAPDFARVWGAAAARAKFQRRRRYIVRGSAIALVLALSIVITNRIFLHKRSRETVQLPSTDLPWQTAVLICEWRSPTEFLLRPPGEHLFEPVPNNLPADTPEQKQ